jgi:hypothetical protein
LCLVFPLPPSRGFARDSCRGGGGGGLQSIKREGFALVDAAVDGRLAAEIDSNGATEEDAGDEAANGEGFLGFFAAGAETETGAGEAVETGESASGD